MRYESDGTYLDYVADYPLSNTQSVEFAQNLLDLTDSLDASDVYTAILPLGKDKLTIADLPDGEVTTGIMKEGKTIYSTAGVEKYIYICRYSQSNRKARSCKEYRFYTFTEISACFRLFKKVVRQNRQKWKGA